MLKYKKTGERIMDYTKTLMWKEINETPQAFVEIRKNNANIMQNLVKDIKKCGKTNFVAAARGTSDHALVFFKYVLETNSKYTVGLAAPSVITLYNGNVNFSESIVIGCSQSGKAEDVLQVLKRGNEQGAITIAVTNDENSPMAKEAKYHLFCSAGEEKSVAATKTFSTEMYLLLWLSAELSGNANQLKLLESFDENEKGFVPEIDKLTTVYAEQFKGMESGFVLSRGKTFPIALEATLKLQETCYIQMKGYAGSDFYHGPMAMVNPNTPVIIYCGKNFDGESVSKAVFEDQIKVIEKMIELKAPVLVVTNDKIISEKYSDKVNVALINAEIPDEFIMFAFALFAQMFACKISCAIGNNPDSPRALKKVTITK